MNSYKFEVICKNELIRELKEKYKNVDGNWVVGEDCGDSYYDTKFENEDIKSIVTKEMHSSVEYRVENN